MSYIAKKGRAAAESATQEKVDATKALVSFKSGTTLKVRVVSFKSGTTLKVRVPSADDVVEVYIHSVFKTINSTPCTKSSGKVDLYDKAVDLLYADAKAAETAGDTKKAEELRDLAYQLKAKPRYLFGFHNLADGQPIIVDLSKKQAQGLFAIINKYEKKLGQLAFELSKTGTGQGTSVTLTPIIDLDDLTADERKHFEATADKAFPDDIYGSVLFVKDEAEQTKDLVAFGFDISRLGLTGASEATPIDDAPPTDDDLGF